MDEDDIAVWRLEYGTNGNWMDGRGWKIYDFDIFKLFGEGGKRSRMVMCAPSQDNDFWVWQLLHDDVIWYIIFDVGGGGN